MMNVLTTPIKINFSPSFQKKITVFVFLLVLCFINFWGSLQNPFMLDDQEHYLNAKKTNSSFLIYDLLPNQTFIQKPGMQEYQNNWGYYRPLTHLFYRFEAEAFGDNPLFYHLLCVLFFALAAFSVYHFLSFIIKNEIAGIVGAVLFLLHPFQGLCVNFKPAIVFPLQIILLNFSFLIVVSNRAPIFSKFNHCIALLLYILGLFTHELAFVFPLILLFYWLVLDRKKDLFFQCVSFSVVSVVYLVIRSHIESLHSSTFGRIFIYNLNFNDFFAAYSRIVTYVLKKLIYPQEIFLQWMTWVDKGSAHQWIWIFWILVVSFLTLLFILFKRHKPMFFLMGIFLAGFILSIPGSYTSVPGGFLFFEPHWIFYTNIGFFGVLAIVFILSFQRFKKISSLVLCGVVIYLVTCSFFQNRLFQESIVYDKKWSENVPGLDLPLLAVCWDKTNNQQFDEAVACFMPLTDGLRSNSAYMGIGYAYFMKGDKIKAEEFFKKSLATQKGDSSAYSTLSFLAEQRGDNQQAIKYIDDALQYDKFSLNLYLSKASLYSKDKKWKESMEVLDTVEKIYPDNLHIDIAKMTVFFLMKDVYNAHVKAKAIIKSSNNIDILMKLTVVLLTNREDVLAQQAYLKAYNINPIWAQHIGKSMFMCPLEKKIKNSK